ncbi:MAG: LicD family protein [Alteromonadaceae bacterium]|nr:LicD family protein [Alteromonadaceae bacterium]
MPELSRKDNTCHGANVCLNHHVGQILDVTLNDDEVVLSGECTINTGKQAVVIVKVGEEVAGVKAIHVPGSSKKLTPPVNFSVPVSLQLISNNSEQQLSVVLANETFSPLYMQSCKSVIELASSTEETSTINIHDVFPSFGFYGGGLEKPLEIDINDAIKGFKLVIAQDSAFLNLSRLEIRDSNGQLVSPDQVIEVQCSSRLNENIEMESLIKGRGFHSLREDNPWYQVRFKNKTDIKKLSIFNRRDKFGARSKGLVVYKQNQSDEFVEVYSSISNTEHAEALMLELKQNLSASEWDECYTGSTLSREKIIDKVLAQCRSNITRTEHWSIGFIEQLLPTWSALKIDEFEIDREVHLLALLIFKQTTERLRFQLQPFAKILYSKESIIQCQHYVNEFRKANGLQAVQFTKHGIALQNKLTDNPDRIVNSTKMLMSDLKELGVKPCIAYGTLLGAVREGAFIAHDDDVDLLIELPERDLSKDTALALAEETLKKLNPENYRFFRASKTGKNINLHVIVRGTGVVLDVFPYWYKGDMAMMHMESMKIRGIPASIMEGRNKIEFYDETFHIPSQPERFLEERYGATWQQSDPFHEWRWALK